MSREKRDKKASRWLEAWVAARPRGFFRHSHVVSAGHELGLRKSDVDRVLDRFRKLGRIFPSGKRGVMGIRGDE